MSGNIKDFGYWLEIMQNIIFQIWKISSICWNEVFIGSCKLIREETCEKRLHGSDWVFSFIIQVFTNHYDSSSWGYTLWEKFSVNKEIIIPNQKENSLIAQRVIYDAIENLELTKKLFKNWVYFLSHMSKLKIKLLFIESGKGLHKSTKYFWNVWFLTCHVLFLSSKSILLILYFIL